MGQGYPQNLPLAELSGILGPNAANQGPNAADALYIDATGKANASVANGFQVQSASTLYSGTGVPSNAIGANGDFYFRTDAPGAATTRAATRAIRRAPRCASRSCRRAPPAGTKSSRGRTSRRCSA